MRLNLERHGDGSPLVFLHGFTGSAATWAPYVGEVPGSSVLAIDLPGHGRSPRPPSVISFPEIADTVVAVLDGHGVGDATWLGYSMGGRVALQVAVRHPTRVRRLIIESASPGIPDPSERRARADADDALATSIERDGLESFVERWASIPLFATQQRLAPEILDRERRGRLANTASGIAAGLRCLSVGRQPSLWPDLPSIDAPTLVVVGADDRKYLALGRSLAAAVPRARLRVVANAGHTVHLEQPALFWSEVRAFLQETDA